MTLERPPSFTFDRAHLLSGFGGVYLANAVVAFLFSASAPVAIILTASQQGSLTEADIASWLFGCYFINGVISLAFCLTYRQPLVFYWTIPGSVLVGQALDHLSFAQKASGKLSSDFTQDGDGGGGFQSAFGGDHLTDPAK
jgi:benzoate membrane transport protein